MRSNQLNKTTPRLGGAVKDSWRVVRERGKPLFYATFLLVVIGLACDVMLIAGLISWSRLIHFSQTQLGLVIVLALAFVFVVAPIIALTTATSAWNWLDKQFSERQQKD